MKLLCTTICITIIFWLPAAAQKTVVSTNKKAKPIVTKAAQKTEPEKAPPITDTLAYNINNTVNKLALFLLDADKPLAALTGTFVDDAYQGQPEYTSLIGFPGAVENRICRLAVYRNQGTALYEWRSYLVKAPKYDVPEYKMNELKERIDEIAKTIAVTGTDAKNKINSIYSYAGINRGYKTYDEVTLIVQFVKPFLKTEQESIDSIKKLYLPGFKQFETAQSAGEKFSMALLAEGINKATAGDVMATEVKKAADINIKIAYQMLMGCSTDLKNETIVAKLSTDQREQIRTIARAYVDAFNEQKPFDVKTFDPNPPATLKPVFNYGNSTYTPTTSLNSTTKPAQEGKRVKCPVCNGSGQVELVDYAHTYTGIYSTTKTQITHWAQCTYCGGGGWVTKYKK